jgi:hypothetical protein
MKNYLLIICMIAGIFMGFITASEKDKVVIVGTWELLSAKINGVEDAQSATMKRTLHFIDNQTFEGRFSVIKGEIQIFNSGKYFMANDTTLVTIHCDQNGQMAPFSSVYTLKIKNDTLHLYGYFIRPVDRSTIMPVFLEEYWGRKK